MDESFWKNWDIFNTILHILGERKRKWMTPTRRRWSQVGKGAGGAAASPTSAAKKDVASNEEKRETACQVYCTLYTRRWRIKNMIAHTCSSSPSQSFPSSHPLAAIRQKSLEGWSDDETFLFWLAWPLDVVWEHAWWPRRSWEKGSSTL